MANFKIRGKLLEGLKFSAFIMPGDNEAGLEDATCYPLYQQSTSTKASIMHSWSFLPNNCI